MAIRMVCIKAPRLVSGLIRMAARRKSALHHA